MTRSTTLIAALTIACNLFGCADVPMGDDVAVITAELGEEHFELVEMRNDGFIDVEVYSAGQAEEITTGIFRWPAADPTPTELTEMLASIPERVIAHATPVNSLTVSVNVVWPRLLAEARLLSELNQEWNLGFEFDETTGLSDCLQAR